MKNSLCMEIRKFMRIFYLHRFKYVFYFYNFILKFNNEIAFVIKLLNYDILFAAKMQ